MFADLIKQFKDVFAPPSVEVIAVKEQEDAKRRLLEMQTTREYADAMCTYYEAQIVRLSQYLSDSARGGNA
jgi:hypothetical protein